jgi:hypothetical protein
MPSMDHGARLQIPVKEIRCLFLERPA